LPLPAAPVRSILSIRLAAKSEGDAMNRLLQRGVWAGVLMVVAMGAGCQSPDAGGGARETDVVLPEARALDQMLADARRDQIRLDRQLEQMRDDLYRHALDLKDVKTRMDQWAGASMTNVARMVALEDKIREVRARAGEAVSAEVGTLRQSLERERQQQARLQALIAEREKEARDLRAALDKQREVMSRPAVPATEPTRPAAAPAKPEPAPAPAVATKEDTAGVYRTVADGHRALKTGDLARARELFNAARAAQPDLAGALLGLAAVAYQVDDLKEARSLTDQVLAKDRRNAQALGLRGLVLWREGFVRDGVRDCARAVDLDPADPLLRKFYGITLNARGQTEEAIEQMRKAVELDAADGEAKLNLAILLATAKKPDFAEARRVYDQALAAGVTRDPELDKLLEGTPAP